MALDILEFRVLFPVGREEQDAGSLIGAAEDAHTFIARICQNGKLNRASIEIVVGDNVETIWIGGYQLTRPRRKAELEEQVKDFVNLTQFVATEVYGRYKVPVHGFQVVMFYARRCFPLD